jgi:hypothetical protein
MAKAPTTDTIAAELTVPERVLLFCLAFGTDWVKTGVPVITVQHLLFRNAHRSGGLQYWMRC